MTTFKDFEVTVCSTHWDPYNEAYKLQVVFKTSDGKEYLKQTYLTGNTRKIVTLVFNEMYDDFLSGEKGKRI